jgi:hypothetical protein
MLPWIGGVESVAQLVEHRPFKALVVGSSPTALTIKHLVNIGHLEYLQPKPTINIGG